MVVRYFRRAPLEAFLCGAALLGLTRASAQAQQAIEWNPPLYRVPASSTYFPPPIQQVEWGHSPYAKPTTCYPSCTPYPPCYPSMPHAVPVQPAQPAKPDETTPRTDTPRTETPETPTPTDQEPSFGGEQSAATGGGDSVAINSPNMIGNSLLNSSRSINFIYQNSGAGLTSNTSGFTNIISSRIADNNSPVPQDRLGFRYNYFNNAIQVQGIGAKSPGLDPALGGNLSIPTVPAAVRQYQTNEYTFALEKTFFDRRASVELRVPFRNSLASDLDLSAGTFTGFGTDTGVLSGNTTRNILNVNPTPGNTFGHSDTEFGDLTLIFKAALFQTDTMTFSVGTSLGMPTASDTRVRVTDYLSDFFPSRANPQPPLLTQRIRTFEVDNETWSLSPFVAVLVTPSERLFVQGFTEVDFPLNSNTVNFADRVPIQLFKDRNGNPGSSAPLVTKTHVREQTLLQTDLGFGYWLMRNPQAKWITGFAPTAEIHYTTTLNDADIKTLPSRPEFNMLTPLTTATNSVPEKSPQVGSLRNRVDILDLTFGTTVELCNKATLATAFSFPTRNGDDRTYDWEFQVQFNYFFGGPKQRPIAPTFD